MYGRTGIIRQAGRAGNDGHGQAEGGMKGQHEQAGLNDLKRRNGKAATEKAEQQDIGDEQADGEHE